MAWQDEAREKYREKENLDKTKPNRLSVKSETEIPEDLSEVISIIFNCDYKGASPAVYLPDLIKKAKKLTGLFFFNSQPFWKDLCALDLSRIKSLSYCGDDIDGSGTLHAASLQSLSLGRPCEMTPMEILCAPEFHLDFSGIPNLASLELKRFSLLNPTDFSHLRHLNKLQLYYCGVNDLRWLGEAEYMLRELSVHGELEDCTGISKQELLEKVDFSYSRLGDASEIGKLPNLKSVNLIKSGVDERHRPALKKSVNLVLTQRDRELTGIVQDLDLWVFNRAVDHVYYWDKHPEARINKSEIVQKWLDREISLPFDERIQRAVIRNFEGKIKKLLDSENKPSNVMTKNDYIELYWKTACQKFPFLESHKPDLSERG